MSYNFESMFEEMDSDSENYVEETGIEQVKENDTDFSQNNIEATNLNDFPSVGLELSDAEEVDSTGELMISNADLETLEEIAEKIVEENVIEKTYENVEQSKGWCMPSVCGGGSTGSWCMPRTTI